MDLLLNDLSLHGQFADLASFRRAVSRIMQIREIARRHGRALYCHRNFVNGQVTRQQQMPEAVKALPLEEQRALMGWLCQHGPFWDEDRQHGHGDWYELESAIVTDTAVGEAAHCLLQGLDRGLVSFQPSDFMFDPIVVDHVADDDSRYQVGVQNDWDIATVTSRLAAASPVVGSWTALAALCVSRFESLIFADNAFEHLRGQPFNQSVAERILTRLNLLDRLSQCFDETGSRTAEGHALYQEHFTGDNGWFSDSSASEKNAFKDALTFQHPGLPDETLFCTWHGKIKSPQYRIHFSWPVAAATPVYVVYVGPKITKT